MTRERMKTSPTNAECHDNGRKLTKHQNPAHHQQHRVVGCCPCSLASFVYPYLRSRNQMISRRTLLRRPFVIARTKLSVATSPSPHLVNRDLAFSLSSTRTAYCAPFASAAAAAVATAVPLPSSAAIASQVVSAAASSSSSQQPDFVQEAIQRLFKDSAVFPAPPTSSASPSAPVSSSPTSSRSDPSPHVSEKVLELSIKTFQARTKLLICVACQCWPGVRLSPTSF